MATQPATLPYRPLPRRRRGEVFLGRLFLWLLSWAIGLTVLAGVAAWQFEERYAGKILPGVAVNGVPLEGLTPAQAEATLQAQLPADSGGAVVLTAAGQSWTASADDLGLKFDVDTTTQNLLTLGREGDEATQWRTRYDLWQGSPLGQVQPQYSRDTVAVDALLTTIANSINRPAQNANVTLQGLTVGYTPERAGLQLDYAASRERVLTALASNQRQVELVTFEVPAHVTGGEAAAQKAQTLLAAPLVLTIDQPDYRLENGQYVPSSQRRQWVIDRARLAQMLLIFSTPLPSGDYTLDARLKPELVQAEVQAVAETIQRPARDARFDYDPNTGSLTPLVVSQDGVSLDVALAMATIEEALATGQSEIALPLTVTPPAVATSDAGNFNISGLAASGVSNYTGSSDEREVNLSVAAQQYHGLVIPPGGVFSFNEHLGWVVDANGYEEGYIISGDRTEVDVGGGVCQASTTIFRAAFNAGFEIVERTPHAYRVQYYETDSVLGFDATIFSPVVDFKFRNDTGNYYLMEIANNRETNILQINLYGAPTNRTVTMDSQVTDVVPHGPDLYEDDPALAVGVTKQVDWAHDGATVVLTRVVRDNVSGAILYEDAFRSDYRPWQARFLVGTGGQ